MDYPEKAKLQAELGMLTATDFTVSQDEHFTYLTVNPANLLVLLQALQQQMGMNYLASITSADYGDDFEIIYHLYAIPDNRRQLAVRTRVPRDDARLESVFSLYPTADWQEREIFDLMGINFLAHPNLVRILLPDDFAGHPLRKDFGKGERRP